MRLRHLLLVPLALLLTGADPGRLRADQIAPGERAATAAPQDDPRRVLVTNDNGIDDPKIVALARAFVELAPESTEVWVVAPDRDRSGSGSYLALTRTGTLRVEPRDLGPGIRAFAVDGYPADCVAIALLGIMSDAPPDLVVSGINGGANLGIDWMFSGTIGAARTAALIGLPAIAVSGLDDDIPGAMDAAVRWVVRLASHALVRELAPGDYLTVSLPRAAPDRIRGVRFADRAPLHTVPRVERTDDGAWHVTGEETIGRPPHAGSDQAAWDAGYIVIVPMRADEVDHVRLLELWRHGNLPGWPPAGGS